jgi:hypothetical protein
VRKLVLAFVAFPTLFFIIGYGLVFWVLRTLEGMHEENTLNNRTPWHWDDWDDDDYD